MFSMIIEPYSFVNLSIQMDGLNINWVKFQMKYELSAF